MIEKVREAELIREPFPHLRLEEVWDAELYEQLVAEWPKRFVPFKDFKGRFAAKMPSTRAWRTVRDALNDRALPAALGKRFSTRYAKPRFETCLFEDRHPYCIGAHTDVKRATMLFYMHSEGEVSPLSLFECDLREKSSEHYGMERMGREFIAEAESNCAVIFNCTARSWHGVRLMPPGGVRRSIQHFLR